MALMNAVDKIPDNAAADQPKSHLTERSANIKVMSAEVKYPQRNNRNKRQDRIVVAKNTPGRACILPMDELEKARDNDFLLPDPSEPMLHYGFGQLIQAHYARCDQGNASIRRFYERCQRTHS